MSDDSIKVEHKDSSAAFNVVLSLFGPVPSVVIAGVKGEFGHSDHRKVPKVNGASAVKDRIEVHIA